MKIFDNVEYFKSKMKYIKPALYLLSVMSRKRNTSDNTVTSEILDLQKFLNDGTKTPCTRTVKGYIQLLLINDCIRTYNSKLFMVNPNYVYEGSTFNFKRLTAKYEGLIKGST